MRKCFLKKIFIEMFKEKCLKEKIFREIFKEKRVGNLRKKKVDFSNSFFRKSWGFRRLIF